MSLALVDELNVLDAKGNGVKTHVVHSSLKVLAVGSGSLGLTPILSGAEVLTGKFSTT